MLLRFQFCTVSNTDVTSQMIIIEGKYHKLMSGISIVSVCVWEIVLFFIYTVKCGIIHDQTSLKIIDSELSILFASYLRIQKKKSMFITV